MDGQCKQRGGNPKIIKQKWILTIQNTIAEMPLVGSWAGWTQLKKESLSLRIYQQKSSKLKNKDWKTEQNIQGLWTTTEGIPEKENKKEQNKYFETVMTENFLKVISDTKL